MEKTRFVIKKSGCVHCREALRILLWVNERLHIGKRFLIYDNFEWEEFGFQRHKIAVKVTTEDGFDGYPFIYCDGIVIEPCQSILLKATLKGLIPKEDFIF